jgi:hypothetical protein
MIITTLFEILGSENIQQYELTKKIEELFFDNFIDKVNSDFNKYRFKKEMELTEKNKKLIKRFTYLTMFYNEVIQSINSNFENNRKEFIKFRINACEKLYLKSIQTCIDMLSLFEKGALTSTFLLWRSIYNDYVIAKFLSRSGEDISECFNEYSRVQRYLLFKEKTTITEEEIKNYKEKYGNNFNNNFGWAINIKGNRNFNSIRKRINETKYYKEYKFTSMFHHASSFTVNNSIFFDDEKHGNTNMVGMFTENIDIPFNLTLSLMKDFTDTMLNLFHNDDYGKFILGINALIESKFIIQKEVK